MESEAITKMPYKEMESLVVILCFMSRSALAMELLNCIRKTILNVADVQAFKQRHVLIGKLYSKSLDSGFFLMAKLTRHKFKFTGFFVNNCFDGKRLQM